MNDGEAGFNDGSKAFLRHVSVGTSDGPGGKLSSQAGSGLVLGIAGDPSTRLGFIGRLNETRLRLSGGCLTWSK